MSKSMLVNVTAEEEHRVAVVDNGVLDLFEIETLSRENIKGNIFKAVVEGVNPALEAAFVNYGGERAAFLPLDEVNFKLYPSRNDGGAKGRGARITRHLEKGMEILAQVIRDSFANKPPTLSTYYSLPGRYLVLMPGADAAGISRKIEDEDQRGRLRRTLESLTIPEGFGVIVRTAGIETSVRELQADLDSLLELWRNIERASQDAKAPSLIYQERDLVVRAARDHFTSDIEEVLIDDEPTYRRLKKFFEAHMPEKADLVKLYAGDRPIFSKFNLEDQIERIYKRVVTLKSGGSISVDRTEALTAIDVNSARSVRGGSSEETAARTNLEAAEEIARQLRLRDIGGLIVIDFIDMESSRHARQVERTFTQAMTRDKARYDVTRISKLGLMEVSRQRLKTTKAESSFQKCPVCAGDGMVRTPEAAARAAFRKIQARVVRGECATVKVYLPSEVALHLLNAKRDDLYHLESRYKMHVEVNPQEQMKVDQFEIEEIRREASEAAPMVTADVVDRAMAEGTFAPPVTPVTEEAPPPRPPQAEGARGDAASEEGRSRGRRRRRRGRGRGRGGEAQAGAPGQDSRAPGRGERPQGQPPAQRPAAAPADFGSGDQPVFSEGPESEGSVEPGPEGPAEVAEPRPGAAADQDLGAARSGRRRRRRRRGRGRGRLGEATGGQLRSAESGAPAAEPAGWPSRSGGNGARSGQDQESPRIVAATSPPAPDDRDRSAPTAGHAREIAMSPSASDAAASEKPKRRWWRRPFKG
ncbi:MAG TPA: Rne/Rng family ribonuclease [Candidatus Cryosericum sp.]|nr:Rne/Rng family ribonuclease [Candidatus Cryosericum sp.]